MPWQLVLFEVNSLLRKRPDLVQKKVYSFFKPAHELPSDSKKRKETSYVKFTKTNYHGMTTYHRLPITQGLPYINSRMLLRVSKVNPIKNIVCM